jgi:dolichol-phosphate mannosyltransferase
VRVLVIVPTYNERDNIGTLLTQVFAAVPEAEVLVVDDGSPDGTADHARSLAGEHRRVEVMVRDERGLGTAYLAGFRHGISHGFDVIVTMDADLSHDPKYLPDMLATLADSDVVIGSRYIRDGGTINWRIRRILLSWLANRFARAVLGLPGCDLTSGYRVYRRDVLTKLNLDRIRSNGYSFLVEVLYLLQRAGARVAERPIVFFDRRLGTSKISRAEIWRGALTLLRLRLRGGRSPALER